MRGAHSHSGRSVAAIEIMRGAHSHSGRSVAAIEIMRGAHSHSGRSACLRLDPRICLSCAKRSIVIELLRCPIHGHTVS